MASITLTEVWLSDANNLSDTVSSDGFGAGGPNDSITAEVRTYAGGRRRVIRRAGKQRSYERTFPAASDELILWLEDHLGQTVLVRDPQGRRFWAVYFNISIGDLPGGAPPDVTITFEAITFSEEV